MRLQEIMSTPVVAIGPDETASAAWRRLEQEAHSPPARHRPRPPPRRDLRARPRRPRGRCGTQGPDGARTDDRAGGQRDAGDHPRQAANLMRGRLIGALPVVEDGLIVGIVTATDVLEELGVAGPAVRPFVRNGSPCACRPSARGERRPSASVAQRPDGGSPSEPRGSEPPGARASASPTAPGALPWRSASRGPSSAQPAARSSRKPQFTSARRDRCWPRSRQGLPAAQARPEARQVRNLDRARERAGGGCERAARRCRQLVGSRWC